MAAHRANSLLAILPNALETGFSEVFPEYEPLKVRTDNIEKYTRQTYGYRISIRTW
jgi:hypothetical protein